MAEPSPSRSGSGASSPRQPLSTLLARFVPSQGRILRVLTSTQNCSALVFSVFLGVHLVSPIAAAIGGTHLADSTLLLAREYYLPYENFLVYAPLGLHLTASLARRSILTYRTRRVPVTSHLVTGWILPTFLIPHILTHRIWPSDPSPPISGLSPSELGFEYVGWNVNALGIASYVTYLGIVGVGLWHGGVGMMKVVSWLRGPRVPKGDSPKVVQETPRRQVSLVRKIGLRGVLVGFLGVIAFGLARVAKESEGASKLMVRRYAAVYGL